LDFYSWGILLFEFWLELYFFWNLFGFLLLSCILSYDYVLNLSNWPMKLLLLD